MKMKRSLAVFLAVCIILSAAAVTAFAENTRIAGDVSGDDKVTPYDAILVQAHLHGELTLISEQISAAIAALPSIQQLSSAHIIAIFFKPLTEQNTMTLTEDNGYYLIEDTQDLAFVQSFPYEKFKLVNDIDMGGVLWTPKEFYGEFDGNSKTIRNLVVAPSDNSIHAGALFTKVGSFNYKGCSVRNFTLENPRLITTQAHQNVGLVCGTNYGTVCDVSVLNGSITGSVGAANAVGAEVGVNYGTVTTHGGVTCQIAFEANCAGLVGSKQIGSALMDYSNGCITKPGKTIVETESRAPEFMDRQAVVDYMREMSQVKWMVQEPSRFKESDFLFRTDPDKIYTGLPYSHIMGYLEAVEPNAAAQYGDIYVIQDATHGGDDYYVPFNDESATSSSDFYVPADTIVLGHIMGRDCSTAVAGAWRRVSTKATFSGTNDMVPTASNCANYGVAKLGPYAMTDPSGQETAMTSWDEDYKKNVELVPEARTYMYRSVVSDANGGIDPVKLEALYESYAQCVPGDAIVYYCLGLLQGNRERSAGHTRLVAQNAYVVRDGLGKIDPQQSYLVTIEQGSGSLNNENVSNASEFSTWAVDKVYTFEQLAGIEIWQRQNDPNHPEYNVNARKDYTVYVPVTNPEYNNPYREQTVFKRANYAQSPFEGIVSSNYGIIYTTVTVDGVSDQQFTGRYSFNVGTKDPVTGEYVNAEFEGKDDSGFTPGNEITRASPTSWGATRTSFRSVNLQKHAPQFENLTQGEHTYTIEVKITTGETKTYSGTFTVE